MSVRRFFVLQVLPPTVMIALVAATWVLGTQFPRRSARSSPAPVAAGGRERSRPSLPEADRGRLPQAPAAEPSAAPPAAESSGARVEAASGPPTLVFPLLEPCPLLDDFGDPRPGGRHHEGTDLMAAKHVPVVAAAAGTVRWVHDRSSGRCCALELEHAGGWSTRYIHLDNDTPGTDDGLAEGIAPGLRRGVRVEAGQFLGWVGDSGNAEEVGPHLHFELRAPDGTARDARETLAEAARLACLLEDGLGAIDAP